MLRPRNISVSFWEIVLVWVFLLIVSPTQSQITVSLNVTNPTCFNHLGPAGGTTGNGVILASAFGGIPPYTYTLVSYTAAQNNGYFPGLSEGNYTIMVTDATGQRMSQPVTLTNTLPQPILQVDILKLPSSCTASDGSFAFDPVGGTPPFAYSLDGGNTYQTINPVITNLQQGFYILYCKDASGCVAAAITTGGSFNFNYFFSKQCTLEMNGGESTACKNDGTLSAWVLNGGIPPFQYSLDGINFQPPNNGTEFTISNLTPGFYPIYAKDATGLTGETVFTIAKNCYTQITFVGVEASCGQSDGSLAATANYGTPPYTYTVDGINFQTSNVFTGLASGGYTISAKDASGEIGSATGQVYDKCPTVTGATTNEICGGQNGTITATGSKGTTPYQFSIDGINFQTSNVFTGLGFGEYIVTIKDANGFTGSTLVFVDNNCVQLMISQVNSTCGNQNGSVTITASNGTSPYQYSIDGVNFQASNIFTGLKDGAFTITVQDAVGLINSTLVTIGDSPSPQINVSSTTASCQNTGGSLSITTIAGTPPFQYSIDGGLHFQNTSAFVNLDSGNYLVYVMDANGCIADTLINLKALPTPVVFLGNDTTLCYGDELTLQAYGNATDHYLWQDNTSKQYFTATTPGIYFVTLTNEFNCSANDTIQISYKPVPTFTLGNDTVLCIGKTLRINATVPNASYLWNTGANSSSISIQNAGLYWLQIDEAGCIRRDSVLITSKSSPNISLGNDTTLCEGQTLVLNAFNNDATYLWQDGSFESGYKVSAAGIYKVKVDLNGCDTSGTISIQYSSKPILNLGKDTSICNSEKALLNAYFPGASYTWQDGSTGSQFQVTSAGKYFVEVRNICGITTDSILVIYENCACKFNVPNVFSPNNDGLNDIFKPKYICDLSDYSLQIFNRWGQLIFQSNKPDMGWDGSYQSRVQPTGTYVWMILYHDIITGKLVRKQGTVVLIR
jgi:gliding motility-associated-like protein